MIPRTEPSHRTDGRLFVIGGDVLVCRHPLSTALPIPLHVRAPGAPELVTWAFAGLGGETESCCLLVLADPTRTMAAGGAITVATHFHDLVVTCPPPRPVDELDGPEREALCGAVLAAMTRRTFAVLAPCLPALAPDMAVRLPTPDAPGLVIAADTDGEARLSGGPIPDYLLMRAGDAWSCARVARARWGFGSHPQAMLSLVPAWGTPSGTRPDRALLIGNAEVTVARLAGDAAEPGR